MVLPNKQFQNISLLSKKSTAQMINCATTWPHLEDWCLWHGLCMWQWNLYWYLGNIQYQPKEKEYSLCSFFLLCYISSHFVRHKYCVTILTVWPSQSKYSTIMNTIKVHMQIDSGATVCVVYVPCGTPGSQQPLDVFCYC